MRSSASIFAFNFCDETSLLMNMNARFYDTYGRDAGYAFNGERQSTLGYDLATGRLATMQDDPDNATPMEFYLFIVQRCCIDYYGGSKNCECCRKSMATILGRVHWTTAKQDADNVHVYEEPRLVPKQESERWLLRHLSRTYIEGRRFFVRGCEEYMKNNTDKFITDSMPVTVEVDYGDKL